MLARRLSAAIPVRRSRYQADSLQPRHYVAQSPLLSHLLTALSMTFPAGEQFFVHTVRQVRDQVTDPELQARISGFIGQEAMHAQAHSQFNAVLDHTDYPVLRYQKQAILGIEQLKQRTPRRQLAATVAYEHFTALLATQLLKRPRFFAGLDPNLQQLWLWHAVEEIEHKSVAFDVYQQVFGNLAQRRRSMRTVSMAFGLGIATMTAHLLWLDRHESLFRLRTLWPNLRDGVELGGLLLRLLPSYLAFYRADFHPDQQDDQALLEHWRTRLALS
jgi:predicted metal-dependent hydrolase